MAVGLAHRMEGAARMAGALSLAEAAERLQQRLETGPLPRDDWQSWVDEVYRALEEVEKLPLP
jgi:two-component system sensor histidine kinase EvgS